MPCYACARAKFGAFRWQLSFVRNTTNMHNPFFLPSNLLSKAQGKCIQRKIFARDWRLMKKAYKGAYSRAINNAANLSVSDQGW